MINPFISNNDSNYLFRKNYQFVAKPEVPSLAQNYSTSKLNLLQNKNPFKPSTTTNIASPLPARSLSNSRVGLSSSQNKLILGKSRLLDEADGWKRELQSQQREKFQTYGAEGLRYNAYTTYTPKNYEVKQTEASRYTPKYQSKKYQQQKHQYNDFNDYYASYSKPIQLKAAKTARDSGYQSNNEFKLERGQPQTSRQGQNRKVRQQFTDEINENDDFRPVEPRRERNKYELQVQPIFQQSQRQSKLVDMFGSVIDDRFKQSMQHHSYASYNADDLVESKPSKFAKEALQRMSYLQESTVKKFQSICPQTIFMLGKTFYKLQV